MKKSNRNMQTKKDSEYEYNPSDYEYNLYSKRIILVNKEFDSNSCAEWMGKILDLDLEDSSKPIILLINSQGGDVYSTFGLLDIIENCKSEVYTVCVGMAASCAAILLIAGTKRFATKNSKIMIHQIYNTLTDLNVSEVENELKEMQKAHNFIVSLFEEKTNMNKAQIEKIHKKDTYFTAKEALKLNIIDEIGFDIHGWTQ